MGNKADKQNEADKKAAEEAAKIEQERLAREKSEQEEADRLAKEKEEADKKAAEEKAKSKPGKGTTSDRADIPLTQENIGDKSKEPSKVKKINTPEGLIEKTFRNVHGISKHYLKIADRPQKESVDPSTNLEIMVYADDGKECSYFENLSDAEIKSYKQFDLSGMSNEGINGKI